MVTSRFAHHEREALQRRARHSVPVRVQDRAAVVHFDEPQSAALFGSRYRDLQSDGRSGIEAYAVRDDAGNTHFWTDEAAGYTWPHGALGPVATAFFADAVVMQALLAAVPSAIALHAAALNHNGRAFAITGHSTAGKSTTAVACVAAGCDLYSDERCISTPAGILPFPRAINLRSGGIDVLIAALPASALRTRLEQRRGANWDDVHFSELFDQPRLPEPAPLSALFSISGRAATPRSRRIRPVDMLAAAQLGAITAATGIDRASAILVLLQGVACYELTLGTPCASARHVLDVVANAAA